VGQGMTREAAADEACRLLNMAMKLLDESRNFAAAANVARAIDLLADAADRGMLTDATTFSPAWDDLVDRQAYAG